MLTGDLALFTQRGDKLSPRYIDERDARVVQTAQALIDLVNEHLQQPRAALDAAFDEYVGQGTDYKVLRGLMKLLLDRCAFALVSVQPAPALRQRLFFAAAVQHPVLTPTARSAVIEQVAAELACAPDDLVNGLYADLPEHHRLVGFEPCGAVELLERYNLAQAQALLYRSTEMRLEIAPQDAPALRGLMEAIKHFRLMHSLRGNAQAGYEIRLSGPVSLFHRSQKYGIQMAVFLPALVRLRGWRMRATIEGKRGLAFFELDSHTTKLRAHTDDLAVDPAAVLLQKLLDNWQDAQWPVTRNPTLINLGETALVPDLEFTHAETGTTVALELLGYWTPRHLQERLLTLERHGVTNYLLVVIEEFRCSREAPAALPAHVLTCKTALKPKDIRQVLELLK